MQTQDLLTLFGLPSTAREIEALFESLGTRHRPSLESDEDTVYHDWILVRRKGVELGFTDSEYFEAAPRFRWGHGNLLFTHCYFYRAFEDVKSFAGELPFGLQLDDRQETVREKLHAFESTRHSYRTDTWDIDSCRLNVQFHPSGGIDRMAYWMLRAPIPRAKDVQCPSLDAIVRAFGSSVVEPDFIELWGDELTSDKRLEASENNEIDFTSSFGATLGMAGGSTGAPVFKSITLHRNRDLESAGWDGELPLGLDFEDSPEMLFKKITQTPVQQSNSTMTGHAVWHFEDYTLHVLYSQIDNRILRVKLIAPGSWKCIEEA